LTVDGSEAPAHARGGWGGGVGHGDGPNVGGRGGSPHVGAGASGDCDGIEYAICDDSVAASAPRA